MKRFLILAVAVALAACSSSVPPAPPTEPDIRIERYPLPIYYAVTIDELQPLELEEVPTIPPANPDPAARAEELKAWSLEVNRVVKANRAKREARIAALELQIRANNEAAELTNPPDPTPTPEP